MASTATQRIIRDGISGKPRTIQNPLLAEHVKVGTYLWYDGHSAMSGWDCPAIITSVNAAKRTFKVRSFDDMREQNQDYSFDVGEHSPSSRQTMRLIPEETARLYLVERKKWLEADVRRKRTAADEANASLALFLEEAKKLNIDLDRPA